MGEILENRRSKTNARFKDLQTELKAAGKITGNRACIYATGSFGRGEASKYSDLDLFIVGLGKYKRRLSRLQEICLKAELISATRKLKIPKFSGDGEYLVHYTRHELVEALGKRHDDANNTFTARLLLLLESRPVLESDIYDETIDSVVEAYWRDYKDHKNDFRPTFLGNDILRLWRTFCVNYEASTSSEPAEKRAKRKLKKYKLAHSRLLTCYSALLYLIATFAIQGAVHPRDAVNMARISPTERLEWLVSQRALSTGARDVVRELINLYENFLQATDRPERELIQIFLDPRKSETYTRSANRLGDLTFEALEKIGKGTAFYRTIVV